MNSTGIYLTDWQKKNEQNLKKNNQNYFDDFDFQLGRISNQVLAMQIFDYFVIEFQIYISSAVQSQTFIHLLSHYFSAQLNSVSNSTTFWWHKNYVKYASSYEIDLPYTEIFVFKPNFW